MSAGRFALFALFPKKDFTQRYLIHFLKENRNSFMTSQLLDMS